MSQFYNDLDIDFDSINFAIMQIVQKISGEGMKIMHDKLEQEGHVVTGKLRSSLRREVMQQNKSWLTELAMQFEMHGRFRDMKQLTYSKAPPVSAMMQFAEKVVDGKGKKGPLQFLSGHTRGTMPAKREAVIRQLAWAMARARYYQPIAYRSGKGWYIRNYMKEIYNEIEVEIKAAAARAALNTVKKALEERK